MDLLPIWKMTNTLPAFNDMESASAIEQTYKVYQKMQDLINNYNEFATTINNQIEEFTSKYNEDIGVFTTSFRQEFQDFIDVVDLKIENQENEINTNVTNTINSYVATEVPPMIEDIAGVIINEELKNLDFNGATLTTLYEDTTGFTNENSITINVPENAKYLLLNIIDDGTHSSDYQNYSNVIFIPLNDSLPTSSQFYSGSCILNSFKSDVFRLYWGLAKLSLDKTTLSYATYLSDTYSNGKWNTGFTHYCKKVTAISY